MPNTIDSEYMLSSLPKQRKTGGNTLGKDEFLNLLMTQLQNQDPMNPMQDKEFIAQMATFSSLEQMTNIATSMEMLLQSQEQNKLIAYTEFVGKEVTWHKIEEGEEGGSPVVTEGTGKVARVEFTGENVVFVLDDGTKLEPANISEIHKETADNQIMQASMLIGRTVTYLDEDKTEKSALVKSVTFKNGKIEFVLGNEAQTTINSSQILKIE